MEEKKLYNAVQKTITLADGREIMIETGKLAKQADGAVVVKMGDTMLLATVVAAKDAKEGVDFMPLQVEYKEKFASCGRFPGGFMKREGKASDAEILVARLIDRALRPLFPADYHADVFVTVNLISADKDIQPDALAGLAASAALAVSDIPFGGPISEVRVARINGEYVINPNFSQMADVDLDIMVGGTIDNILMVEGEMNEVSEEVMLGAIKFAHEEIKKHCAVQIELSKELGKDVKRTYSTRQTMRSCVSRSSRSSTTRLTLSLQAVLQSTSVQRHSRLWRQSLQLASQRRSLRRRLLLFTNTSTMMCRRRLCAI